MKSGATGPPCGLWPANATGRPFRNGVTERDLVQKSSLKAAKPDAVSRAVPYGGHDPGAPGRRLHRTRPPELPRSKLRRPAACAINRIVHLCPHQAAWPDM